MGPSSFSHWYRMYRLMIADVTISPAALTKYPLLQSAPPHMISFISGRSFMRRIQDTLFRIFTNSAGLNLGGALTKRWTWSGITSCSTIWKPYRSAVPTNILFSVCAMGSFNTTLRYFGTQTKWYFSSHTAWLVRPYSMPNTLTLYAPALLEGGSSAPARGAVSARGTGK